MNWDTRDGCLVKRWEFADFSAAFAFAARAALVFEQQGHHGELTVGWGFVAVSSTTHDAGNRVTEKDHKLAEALDKLEGRG